MLGQKLGDQADLLPEPELWAPLNRRWEIPNLPPFRNLNQLHIHNMWGRHLERWRKMITVILVNSPGLSDLGFSLSTSTRCRDLDPEWHDDLKVLHPAHFLRELCRAYARAGGKPLDLQRLHLGHYMFVLRRDLNPKGLRPQFPDERQNGGCLDKLANLSQLKDLSLDLVGDGEIYLEVYSDSDDNNSGDNNSDNIIQSWWQTAPGPLPKLEKLSVRRPTTWLARWAKGIVREGTPLRQLKVNQADKRCLEYAEKSELEASWSDLLDCRPQELLLHGHADGVVNLDRVMAAGDSIRLLAMTSWEIRDFVECVASQMPKLEGIWIMEPDDFYDGWLGEPADIQERKTKWAETVQVAARVCPTLKCFRVASITWRIVRMATEIYLHELDRMENEREIPELFQISLPYSFDMAHAAKYWVKNRRREKDDLI